MNRRKPMNPATDHKIFTHTARKTKKINVSPTIQRGGIRL